MRRVFKSDDSELDRTERAPDGGTVVLTTTGWEVKGKLGCGLKGKGGLDGLSFKVKGDAPLQGQFDGEHLTIASQPDDEHGLVVTSVFEKTAPKGKAKDKAKGKAMRPAAKKSASAKRKK